MYDSFITLKLLILWWYGKNILSSFSLWKKQYSFYKDELCLSLFGVFDLFWISQTREKKLVLEQEFLTSRQVPAPETPLVGLPDWVWALKPIPRKILARSVSPFSLNQRWVRSLRHVLLVCVQMRSLKGAWCYRAVNLFLHSQQNKIPCYCLPVAGDRRPRKKQNTIVVP